MRAGILRSLSLETKFALLIALISLPVLTAVSAGAFYFIKERSRHYQEQNLALAAEVLSLHVASFADAAALTTAQDALPGVLRRRQIGMAVRDVDGRDLASTQSIRVPPEIAAQAAATGILDWQASPAASFRVYAGNARLGDGTPVQLVLTQDATGPASVEHAYQNVLIVIALTGGMLTVALGSLLAQRGLEPLRRLTVEARGITASRLDDPLFTKLGIEDAPVELRELAEGLNAMLQRLQDSFRRLDEFSSDLAHELRTPIGNMLGQSEVALSRARSVEEYRAVLESNVEEFQRLSRMIHDMLFLAKADSSQSAQGALTRERVDLAQQAGKVLEYYEPLLEEKNIRVRRQGAGSVHANRLLVQRAIANLLSNAIRHAPEGSDLEIAIAPNADEAGSVALRISNAGARIPQEDLPWIFQRFFRGDAARRQARTSGEGWGLGLSIVKAIMDMHAGRVKAQTEEGRTSFTLYFPGIEGGNT